MLLLYQQIWSISWKQIIAIFVHMKYVNKCLEDKFLQTSQAAFARKCFRKQKRQVSLLNSGVTKVWNSALKKSFGCALK